MCVPNDDGVEVVTLDWIRFLIVAGVCEDAHLCTLDLCDGPASLREGSTFVMVCD